ncbi:MAG: DUF1273 domain-containing protein [Clostridiales bacterium]|nr:DUF1273 domain-containing protein [Clostridiales bacterium]
MPLTPKEESARPYTACFTGHRQLDENELPALVLRLDQVLEKLYQQSYRRFICGGALGFDMLAAERVIALKKQHEDVSLVLAIPYAAQSSAWPIQEGMRYERIFYEADESHVLSRTYYKGCLSVRNRHMVDRSSFVVCYLTQTTGGTASTAAYAFKEGVTLLNLAMPDACEAFCR